MAKIDIDAILNIPDEFIVNGKSLFVREFTTRERIAFSKAMYDQTKNVMEQIKLSTPGDVLKNLNTKDISDFRLLDFIFKTCTINPITKQKEHDNNFTTSDFDVMTTTQIKTITDVVFKKNNFFQQEKGKEEAK